jgi:sulfite exporter TauE/SafE
MDQDQALLALLAAGVSHCAVVITDKGSLLVSLLFTGLVGGLSHCSTMCGPFVLSQVSARMEAIPASQMREWHRLTGAALLPYHLGRGTTYMALGAIGAALAGSLSGLGGLRWLSAALLIVAAMLLVGYALPQFKVKLPGGDLSERWWSGRVAKIAKPLFSAPLGFKGYLLGLLLGFIPCGLLYGALTAAASTGDPVAGAMGMGAFVLGTLPTLFAVGLLGHFAGQRWRAMVRSGAPILLLLNAGVLTWLAISLIV